MSVPKKIILGITHPVQQGINPLDLRNSHPAPPPPRLNPMLPKPYLAAPPPVQHLPTVVPGSRAQAIRGITHPLEQGLGPFGGQNRTSPSQAANIEQHEGGPILGLERAIHPQIKKLTF